MVKSVAKLSDEELLSACGNNDQQAFNELFRRYAPKLYKQAVCYIKDTSVAEELMMDLMVDLWEKRHERKITGSLSAYLYRYMRNLIVDQLRKRLPNTTPLDVIAEYVFVDGKQADHGIAAAEAEKLYQAVLQELSPQRRRVFQLSREENLTYVEIAKEMNLSVNTVENYMVAALRAFRIVTKDYVTLTKKVLMCLLMAGSFFFI